MVGERTFIDPVPGMSSEYSFIDRNWQFIKGDQARPLVEKFSDRPYLQGDRGIVRVPRDRWHVAQDAEANAWMNLWQGNVQDRNLDHFIMFDKYKPLADRRYDHAIELGCGPFSNLSFVGMACQVARCSLLDPLIQSYVSHPNCTYRGSHLVNNVVGEAPQIPIVERIASPIEDMPTDRRYDLVVMINVIEHCFDVDLIFDRIATILAPGGMFCFHDKYFSTEEIEHDLTYTYDAGHPLKVEMNALEAFLTRDYVPRFRRTISTEPGYDSLYFIGERR